MANFFRNVFQGGQGQVEVQRGENWLAVQATNLQTKARSCPSYHTVVEQDKRDVQTVRINERIAQAQARIRAVQKKNELENHS